MKLDSNQRDFILNEFFKLESVPGWKNIAEKLIDNGECIIGGNCPWCGGIGNFIESLEDDTYIGCIKLKFDLERFINPENKFFINTVNGYYFVNLDKKNKMESKLKSINQFRLGTII